MVRITAVSRSVASVLEAVGDLSYAWEILGDYVAVLHARVRAEPRTAVLLRATFLKLASILDVPLVRIAQLGSPDAASVAAYYSGELVTFVRRVLDVVPVAVFALLGEIVRVQTRGLAPLPVKLETAYLKEYAQLPERYALAKLTNQVSVFTEGVLAMEKTLLGVVRVDPRRVLHDGLRTELVRRLSATLHETLVFPPLPKKRRDREADAFRSVLERLATDVAGFRRSVEYVQDYIDIAGLKMWQEELARVVDYNVERECNRARRGRNRTRTGSPRTRARLSGRGTDPIRGHLARRGESPARESGDASRERPRDERVKRARNRESPIPTQASCAAR